MKYLKYILLFLAGLAAAWIISKKNNTILLPFVEVIPPETPAFSLDSAPTESLRGEIATMSGEIRWQGRTATEAALILSPIAVQQGENLITGENGSLDLIFPGACTVKMTKNTKIGIIQTLPANIVFSQTGGNGEYIKSGNYPVSVRANKLLAEANGDITVSFDAKKPVISVTVLSGNAIGAFNDLKYVSHEVIITAGQKFTFNYDTRKGVLR